MLNVDDAARVELVVGDRREILRAELLTSSRPPCRSMALTMPGELPRSSDSIVTALLDATSAPGRLRLDLELDDEFESSQPVAGPSSPSRPRNEASAEPQSACEIARGSAYPEQVQRLPFATRARGGRRGHGRCVTERSSVTRTESCRVPAERLAAPAASARGLLRHHPRPRRPTCAIPHRSTSRSHPRRQGHQLRATAGQATRSDYRRGAGDEQDLGQARHVNARAAYAPDAR